VWVWLSGCYFALCAVLSGLRLVWFFTLALCFLVAASQFFFEVAWVRDGLVKVDAP